MNEPSKHFKPQTRRSQLRVVQSINAAELAMLPVGFDAEAMALDMAHFTCAATPLAHEVGSVTRLQDQLKRANDEKRRLDALAALPLAPLAQQHRAAVARYKPITTDPLLLDTGIPVLHRVHNPQMPPRVSATAPTAKVAGHRTRAPAATTKTNNTTTSERRSIIFVVAIYLAVIVATAAITITTRG